MSCADLRPELGGYYFGLVSGELRERIEAHLLDCRECLGSFLVLKRTIETAELVPPPSPALRDRLRKDVARELQLSHTAQSTWSWWERPLAYVLAAVTVLVAVVAMNLLASGAGSRPHGMLGDRPSNSVPR